MKDKYICSPQLERVLAYGIAIEMGEEDLHPVVGGASHLTHYPTNWYTNKKLGGDEELDDDWDL